MAIKSKKLHAANQKSVPTAGHGQTVRFYFDVSILCLIPRNPNSRHDGRSEAAWEERQIERIQADLISRFPTERAAIAYRKHEAIDDARRLYIAHFVVSVRHNFTAAEWFTPHKGYVGFSVKSRRLLKARASLETMIRDALNDTWVIDAVSYAYAASWTFIFEVYIGGSLELRHVLPQSDIDDADGSVRQAIESFNDNVVSSLEGTGFSVFPRTTARRPKNNVYKFDVYYEVHAGVSEDEVSGDIALLKKGLRTSEFPYLELNTVRDIFDEHAERASCELEAHDFPDGTQIVRAPLYVVDYDEDVYGYEDSLVP